MLFVGLYIACGLALLAFAPDRLVAGSAGLAERWRVPAVVVGAVVIGFGTSTPELVVSGLAALDGEPEVGVGNVVGSNLANLGLVVAVAGLVGQVVVPDGLLRRELPLMVAATVAFAAAVQGGLSRVDGVLLALGLAVALTLLLRSRREGDPGDRALAAEVDELLADEKAQGPGRMALDVALGLAGTLAGAQLLVSGAVEIADDLGLSGGFVGLTVVALGTSLPELVTAVAAARAGEDQLIVGNVLGSNMFNSLAVGALIGLAGPAPLDDAGLTVGAVALMLALTALATAAMVRRRSVSRREALTLLVAYLATMPLLAG